MRPNAGRRAAVAAAGPRPYFDENKRAVPVAHHKIDFSAAARHIARDEPQPLPPQKIKRKRFKLGSDAFRLAPPRKVVGRFGSACSSLAGRSCARRLRRPRVAQ